MTVIHKCCCCCCTQWLLKRLESRWPNIKSDQHRTLTRIYLPTHTARTGAHTHTSPLENPAPPLSAAHLSCLVAFSVHKQSLLSCCVPELSVPLLSKGFVTRCSCVPVCLSSEGAASGGQAFAVITHSFRNARIHRLTRLQKREETGGKHVLALQAVNHFSAQLPPAAKICCPFQ